MLKRVTFRDCIGKTIKGVGYNGTGSMVAITFQDGTYAMLTVRGGRYDSSTIEDQEYAVDQFSHCEAIRIGLATQEEIDEARAKREEQCKLTQEANERRLLAKLKAKYSE